MAVPYLDLKQQHAKLKKDILADVESILDSAWFVGGNHIKKLEEDFARKCGVAHAVAVSSGTMACKLAYGAAGLSAGHEMITTPNTFFATCEAAYFWGAKVSFCDVNPDTFVMNIPALEKAVTGNTKLIVPVHLYGLACDMPAIMDFANSRGIEVVEDCAQAHFANCNGAKVGSFGKASAFSFYPSKNLGAIGDAGMVVTDCAETAETLQVLRNHGQTGRYMHSIYGENGRMSEIQAAALNHKMKHIDDWTSARQRVAAQYRKKLAGIEGLSFQAVPEGRGHVYYMFAICHDRRDEIAKVLKEREIGFAFQGVQPLHLQKVFAGLYTEGDLPNVERVMSRMLSLPIFPEMTQEMIDEVCTAIHDAVG